MEPVLGSDDSSGLLYNLACECETLFNDRLAELRSQNSVSDIELVGEYQHSFAAWAANLGVFARKSQSLDTRLEDYPDIVDITARLLDIIRRSLSQRECHRSVE